MVSDRSRPYEVFDRGTHRVAVFTAMAGSCEVHIRDADSSEVRKLASLAYDETTRIEKKFSRYRLDNVTHAINTSEGRPVPIDPETYSLLHFAGEAYRLSDGLFDITSGVLRRAWQFDGEEFTPDGEHINALRHSIGWDRVELKENAFRIEPAMEIDFGGLGKEYAVDRVGQLLFEKSGLPMMINFGGDIRVFADEREMRAWDVGVEEPGQAGQALGLVQMTHGAVATSGDSRRHCFVNGKRLGHILNPKTGWPVEDAPHSVTVISDFCMEAGLLSTLGMLHGAGAEAFLERQGVKYHCVR